MSGQTRREDAERLRRAAHRKAQRDAEGERRLPHPCRSCGRPSDPAADLSRCNPNE
jgi:hypothetical protein